jgi:hypothetical protein
MANKSTPSGNFWFVWRAPTILAILTLFGLLTALLKTGAWHWAAWLALAATNCCWSVVQLAAFAQGSVTYSFVQNA